MHIIRYEFLSEADLLSRLRHTRLRGFNRAEVYRNATLEILESDPETLMPSQRYVLNERVRLILDLADAFEVRGIDIFALRGALLFWLEGTDPEQDLPVPFLPPVVEESVEPDGTTVRLINDGMHRVYAARKRRRKINVVLARQIPPQYPYYAYALPGGWAEVEALAGLPQGYKKRQHRNPEEAKALFRDFNEIFPGLND